MSTELAFTTHDDVDLTVEVIEIGDLYADGETTMMATEPLIVIRDEHEELGMFALAGLGPGRRISTSAFSLAATDVTGLLDAVKAHRAATPANLGDHDLVCAECGTTDAATWVVTFTDGSRTEVCLSCHA